MHFETNPRFSENEDVHAHSTPSAERMENDKLFERFTALKKFHNELLEEHREAEEQKAMQLERDMTNVLDEMWTLLQLARGRKDVAAPKEEPAATEIPREAEDIRTKVQRLRGEVRELIAQRQRYEQEGDAEMAAEVEKQIAAKMEEFPARE